MQLLQQQQQLTGSCSSYGSPAAPPSAVQAALGLASDPQPHVRQQALALLSALGQQHSAATTSTAGEVDAIFQRLCVIAATDTIAQLRLQALQALAGEAQASVFVYSSLACSMCWQQLPGHVRSVALFYPQPSPSTCAAVLWCA